MKIFPKIFLLKITFVIDKLNHGGAERQLIELVRNFDRRLFEITVIIFHPVGELTEELENISDIKLIFLGKANRWDIIRVFSQLYKILRTQNNTSISLFNATNKFFDLIIVLIFL